jgi:hypothetical protein
MSWKRQEKIDRKEGAWRKKGRAKGKEIMIKEFERRKKKGRIGRETARANSQFPFEHGQEL